MADEKPCPGRFQFSLPALFLAIATLASALALEIVWPTSGLLLVGGAAWFYIVWNVVQYSPVQLAAASRNDVRARRFRGVFWATIQFAVFWNLLPAWQSYRVNDDEIPRRIGWPMQVALSGDYEGLVIDIAVAIIMAAAIGVAVQDGGRKAKVVVLRFLYSRRRARNRVARGRMDLVSLLVAIVACWLLAAILTENYGLPGVVSILLAAFGPFPAYIAVRKLLNR